jgi:hypothetical protein
MKRKGWGGEWQMCLLTMHPVRIRTIQLGWKAMNKSVLPSLYRQWGTTIPTVLTLIAKCSVYRNICEFSLSNHASWQIPKCPFSNYFLHAPSPEVNAIYLSKFNTVIPFSRPLCSLFSNYGDMGTLTPLPTLVPCFYNPLPICVLLAGTFGKQRLFFYHVSYWA